MTASLVVYLDLLVNFGKFPRKASINVFALGNFACKQVGNIAFLRNLRYLQSKYFWKHLRIVVPIVSRCIEQKAQSLADVYQNRRSTNFAKFRGKQLRQSGMGVFLLILRNV